MNRREQLQERYEDALFALLMDEIATMEGKEAQEENERLKNDPSAAIPEDVDKRCLQTIRHHFAKQKAYSAGRFTVKTMKRVVMAAGIAAILFTGAFAISEDVRANTMNMIIEVFETNTELRFESRPDSGVVTLSLGWLPEGYILTDSKESYRSVWYQYRPSETAEESIWVNCSKTKGATFGIDTEGAAVEYIELQGYQVMQVEKEQIVQLVWTAKDNTLLISVIGEGVEKDVVLRVAEHLSY